MRILNKFNTMKYTLLFLVFLAKLAYTQPVIKTDLVYKVNEAQRKNVKSPVLIMLHGYGSNESDLFDIAKGVDERFITFSLRAPYEVKGQGYCWFNLDFLPEKKFKYNYSEVKKSASRILDFINQACRAYKADSTQVFIMGYSQGAMLSYEMAFAYPDKIKGIAALSGFILPETKQIKSNPTKLANVNFFMAHGQMDQVVDIKDAESTFKFIQSKKLKVEYKTYSMPHAINGQELNDIKAWLKKNVKAEKRTDIER